MAVPAAQMYGLATAVNVNLLKKAPIGRTVIVVDIRIAPYPMQYQVLPIVIRRYNLVHMCTRLPVAVLTSHRLDKLPN